MRRRSGQASSDRARGVALGSLGLSPAAAAQSPTIEQIDDGTKVIGLRVERNSIRTFL